MENVMKAVSYKSMRETFGLSGNSKGTNAVGTLF